MSNAAPWAATAGNKFRELARSTENPTTKLLAEGLTSLTEALRELDDKREKVERRAHPSATESRPARPAAADELVDPKISKDRDDLVFTDQRGGVLRNSNWRARVFAPAVQGRAWGHA